MSGETSRLKRPIELATATLEDVALSDDRDAQKAGRALADVALAVANAGRVGYKVELTSTVTWWDRTNRPAYATIRVVATAVDFFPPWRCTNRDEHEDGAEVEVVNGHDACQECGRYATEQDVWDEIRPLEQLTTMQLEELLERQADNAAARLMLEATVGPGPAVQDEARILAALETERAALVDAIAGRVTKPQGATVAWNVYDKVTGELRDRVFMQPDMDADAVLRAVQASGEFYALLDDLRVERDDAEGGA